MLSLNELKIHTNSNRNRNKVVLSKHNPIANFIEISILTDLDSNTSKFTIIDVDDVYFYADKKLSKKEIRKTILDELESNGYTFKMLSRRRIAICLGDNKVKKPKILCTDNIVLTYFAVASIINLIYLTLGVFNSTSSNKDKLVYLTICGIGLILAYVTGKDSYVNHALYDLSKDIYNENRGV